MASELRAPAYLGWLVRDDPDVAAIRYGDRASERKLQQHINPQRFFVAGQAVELWEDPRLPFGCGFHDLEAYCLNARWDLLFNAIVIACLARQDAEEEESSPPSPRCAWAGGVTSPAADDVHAGH